MANLFAPHNFVDRTHREVSTVEHLTFPSLNGSVYLIDGASFGFRTFSSRVRPANVYSDLSLPISALNSNEGLDFSGIFFRTGLGQCGKNMFLKNPNDADGALP